MPFEHDLYASNDEFSDPLSGIQLPAMPFNLENDGGDDDDKSPLHHAVIRKDKQLVIHLLRSGASIRQADRYGHEPIHYGVLAERTEIVQLILQFGGDVNAKGQLGRSPLHMAVSLSHLEMVKLLLRNRSSLSEHDIEGNTPLHLALLLPFTAKTSQQLLMSLLEAGADVNAPNKLSKTPFQHLLDLNYPQVIFHPNVALYITTTLVFLKHGAQVAQPFADGRMPIDVFLARSNDTWAYKDCENNSRAQRPDQSLIVQLLDRCGSSSIFMPSGEPLAHYYIRKLYGQKDVDGSLAGRLCNLADPQLSSDSGNTLLHELMLKGILDIRGQLGDLLNRGFDLNSCNKAGHTPLQLFLNTHGQTYDFGEFNKIIEVLAGYEIDPWLRCNSGNCILFEASSRAYHKSKFMKMLLQRDLSREAGALQDWPEWEEARLADSWADSGPRLFKDSVSASRELRRWVRDLAFLVLAEKHLDSAKHKFTMQDDRIQQQRAYMARILKDCRTHNIKMNMRFYDELLALCWPGERKRSSPSSWDGMDGPVSLSDDSEPSNDDENDDEPSEDDELSL